MLRSLTVFALAMVLFTVGPVVAAEKCDLPLVFEDDFESGAGRWQPTDSAAWRIIETDRGKVYNQFKLSNYKPPHCSPYNVSLLKDVVVGDFVLTVKVQSTQSPAAGWHRDMCLFFNYQDPAHFYYVHLGKHPDPNSCQIMLVNGAPRKPITKNQPPGIPWDKGWHDVKIVRRVADGTIEIYFDDMKKPVMVAVDKTFTWGRVGLGSFDDHGNWDDFKLYGKEVAKPKSK